MPGVKARIEEIDVRNGAIRFRISYREGEEVFNIVRTMPIHEFDYMDEKALGEIVREWVRSHIRDRRREEELREMDERARKERAEKIDKLIGMEVDVG